MIHVAGSYFIYRADGFLTNEGTPIPKGFYITGTDKDGHDADIYAIALTVQGIHNRCVAASHILFSYDFLLPKLSDQKPIH